MKTLAKKIRHIRVVVAMVCFFTGIQFFEHVSATDVNVHFILYQLCSRRREKRKGDNRDDCCNSGSIRIEALFDQRRRYIPRDVVTHKHVTRKRTLPVVRKQNPYSCQNQKETSTYEIL